MINLILVEHLLNIAKKIKNLRETGDSKHLYRNELDKACFAHNAAYFHCKDLANKIFSDKMLKDRPYEIARNRNYDRYQGTLASRVYKFFN